MSNYHKPLAAKLSREEDGQIAVLMIMILPVVFLFFALALDAGIWFFDHRLAQNQADAAALAAVQHLPAVEFSEAHIDAEIAVETWVTKNGSNPGEPECGDGGVTPSPEFRDVHPAPSVANPPGGGDGRLDWVRVCVRRKPPGIFSGLAGLNFIYVSAAATARVGPVSTVAQVMPWGVVPPSIGCGNPGEACYYDMDNDPGTPDQYCGQFPPVDPGEALCPWGLSEDRLYVFKYGDWTTPGNFAAIAACGVGVDEYGNCIEGELATEFYEEGETVNVQVAPGNFGKNTHTALNNRFAIEAADGIYECDVPVTPDPLTGMDTDGRDRVQGSYVEGRTHIENPGTAQEITYEFRPGCDYRLVSIPVLAAFPPQGAAEDVLVLGVSTFAIVGWDRQAPWSNDEADTANDCGNIGGPGPNFACEMVWGFFMKDALPPDILVNRISDSGNPFAPLMIAMVE